MNMQYVLDYENSSQYNNKTRSNDQSKLLTELIDRTS